MDIRELRSFCVVAELRSVTKAADQLNLGQPAVTLHIKALEQELNARLLDRTKRPLQVTPAGVRLLELARPIISGVDALPNVLSGKEDTRHPVLAVTNEVSASIALPCLADYHGAHPETQVTVKGGRVGEVIQMLRSHEADLGIMPVIEGASAIENLAVYFTSRVVITPIGHPLATGIVTLASIARYPLIIASAKSDTPSYLEEQMERNGLSYNTLMDLDSCEAVKEYVARGFGVSVLPRICIGPDDHERLHVITSLPALPRHRIALCRLSERYLPAPAVELAVSLATSMRSHFDSVLLDDTGSL